MKRTLPIKDTPIKASVVLSNFGGLVVLDIQYGIDDYLITGFCFGDTIENIAKSKIRTSIKDDRLYILRYGQRYYLDDMMAL